MTQFELDVAFDKIWAFWINKVNGENSARKSLSVTLKVAPFKDIFKACRIYALDHEGDDPSFTKKLSNFLLQDEWKDVLDGADLAKLEKQRLDAIDVISAWNISCKPHWCKVFDIDERVPLSKKALANKYFKTNWKIALDKCIEIFQYTHLDSDPRSKININFRWFTNISNDRHTVLRIMEGELGAPAFHGIIKPIKVFKKITKEEREISIKLFNEVFKGIPAEIDPPSFD